jgi:hypothetical protein
MTTYDTTKTSTYEIEADIVEGAIAHGTSSEEILASCENNPDVAAKAIVEFYETEGADAEFLDEDGDDLPICRYALAYFERLAKTLAATA